MDTQITALLFGYGSIGRRHARFLSTLIPELIIIDTNETTRAAASVDHPTARVLDLPTALNHAEIDWSSAVAVIATWGPSHAALFHELADRGVRRIVCEKPLATSALDAAKMVQRAERDGIVLAVNQYFRYGMIVPALQRFFAEHSLGAPVALVVEGGAACLVTNGIHWVDFANELFGSTPQQVISSATGEAINPRSPDLGFYGGTAIWSFSGGREAVLSFSNLSSVAPVATIYLRNAIVTMNSDLEVAIRRRDPAAVARFGAVTRTGPATDLLFEGMLPGVLAFEDRSLALLRDVAFDNGQGCTGAMGAAAVEMCIGALIAGREGCAVTLPLDTQANWAAELWPIS